MDPLRWLSVAKRFSLVLRISRGKRSINRQIALRDFRFQISHLGGLPLGAQEIAPQTPITSISVSIFVLLFAECPWPRWEWCVLRLGLGPLLLHQKYREFRFVTTGLKGNSGTTLRPVFGK